MSQQIILVHRVKPKPIIKARISGKVKIGGISDVATTSVHSEKTCMKKCMMNMIIIIIITEKPFTSK